MIVSYKELMNKGIGYFLRQIGSNFFVVSNRSQWQKSVVISEAKYFSDVLKESGRTKEAEQIDDALVQIKEDSAASFSARGKA